MFLAVGMLLQRMAISGLTCAPTLESGPTPVMNLAVGMLLQRVAD